MPRNKDKKEKVTKDMRVNLQNSKLGARYMRHAHDSKQVENRFGHFGDSESDDGSTDYSKLSKKVRKAMHQKMYEEQKRETESIEQSDQSSSEASFDIEDDSNEVEESNGNDLKNGTMKKVITEVDEDDGWQISGASQNKQGRVNPNSNSNMDEIYQKKYKKLLKDFKFIKDQNAKMKKELDVKSSDIVNQSQKIQTLEMQASKVNEINLEKSKQNMEKLEKKHTEKIKILKNEMEKQSMKMEKIKEEKENIVAIVDAQNLHINQLKAKLEVGQAKHEKKMKDHIQMTNHLIDSIIKQVELSSSQVHQVNNLKTYLKDADQKNVKDPQDQQLIERLECQICLEEFLYTDNQLFAEYADEEPYIRNKLCIAENKDERRRRYALPCGHDLFHHKCIKKWFQSKNESNRLCPICKEYIAEID